MTPAAILTALLTYGPTILPLIQQVTQWVKDGKQEVSAEDIAELIAYGKKMSADYLLGVGLIQPVP